MPTSEARLYLHLVWTTKRREPTIPEEYERSMHRVIQAEARKMRCKAVAVGGTADHVHVLLQFGRFVSLSRLVHQMKGTSSSFINAQHDQVRDTGREELPRFRWQEGYGTFSIGLNQIAPVTAYINRQKEHHASGNLWSQWEDTDEM